MLSHRPEPVAKEAEAEHPPRYLQPNRISSCVGIPVDEDGSIPIKALLDGAWYQGTGRTGPVALWDGEAQLFRTIGVQSWPDPTRYPAIRRRITGLKTEKHVQMQGGTFSPQSVLAR